MKHLIDAVALVLCATSALAGFQVKPAVGKPANDKAVEAMVVPEGVETDSLKPFPVLKRPLPSYLADENRHFQGCPSVTMSRGGRLWCTWLSGAATESQDNALVGATSGDGGKTWSGLVFAIDREGPLRPLDAGLWTAPDGNVYLFYCQMFGFWDGRGGLWVRRAADPENPDTDWIEPRRICDGYLKNKPTLLEDGRLLLPVEFFEDRYEGLGGDLRHFTAMPERFHFDSSPFQHANVFVSDLNLTKAAFLGQSHRSAEGHAFPENMIVERRDGSLWMLTRTYYGIGESVSADGGRTWTDTAPCAIRNTSSRFYLGRLRSGALLLVKNGGVADNIGRARIMAFVSDDDGRTWQGGLVLDERDETSYPDACEGADGFIHVVNDWSREKGREIVHHRFTEADVRAGRLVSPGSRLGSLVNKAGCAKKAAPVKVILDTDMIADFDDVGALACLHALADAGECEILATVSSTRGNASVAAIEVINAYYGRGDLPVGAPKGMGVMGECPGTAKKVDPSSPLGKKTGGDGGHYKYRKLAADYPNWVKHVDADDAPDANEVYRKILAAAPDKSVVICSIGFLTNLRRLLETKPDAVSPLDGRALVVRKVKRWVAMACSYPFGKEYNSMSDAESSKIVLENWPTPVVFSDFQYGYDVYAGRAVAEMDGPRNPVKDVFAGNIPTLAEVDAAPSKWMRGCFGRAGRAAWDETAVLAAVRGTDSYFNVHRGTYRMIGAGGENEWVPDEEKGPHLRLTEKVNKREVGKVIDELICRGPLALVSGRSYQKPKVREIVFASWNIGHFALGKDNKTHVTPEDADERGAAYRRFLDTVGADILGVAEYYDAFTTNGSVRADEAVFARYGRRIVGPRHAWQWNAQFFGVGEVLESHVKEYEKHLQNVYYIATRVKVCGEEVVFVETHLDWGTCYDGHEDDRASQMRELIADFKDEKRVVIAGDFNVGIRSKDRSVKTLDNPSEYKVFEEAGFTLGNDGRFKTAPAGEIGDPDRSYALDNIIVKGVKIRNFTVFDCPDLSDHALVRAELVLE